MCFNVTMRHRDQEAHGYCAIVALLLLSSCGGGGGGGGETVPVAPSDPIIGEALIGPAGGDLIIATGENAGVSLTVPAGAVAVETRFRVLRDLSNDEVPSLFPIYRIEPESLDFSASPVTVTVPMSDEFLPGTTALSMFTRIDDASPWQAKTNTTVDAAARTATAVVTRLGEFLAWQGHLHRLFTQELRLYDPAEPVASEFLNGTQVTIDNGTIPRTIGQGSLASLWNSPTSENVIILHSVFGSPLDFLGTEDLVANLGLTRSNVVLLSFPSARGIAYAANELYDLIANNKKPGFGCSIIGHSIGAMVGRYMLEKSATDPARRGFQSGDTALEGVVDQLIMLGVPNAGAQTSTIPFAAIEAKLPESERWLLQVGQDLGEQPESLPFVMNVSYVNNATRYHIIYGDLGNGSDGVVTTASALALPLTAPESATLFMVQHDDLHRRATTLGIAVWIGTLLQGQ
ncbi:MAG: pimeloyl-ACP methyl ester carboxylesterase [Planctomycetota bacterium]|jgi:pimeloyl-ACP methyl ester carboxylesterase